MQRRSTSSIARLYERRQCAALVAALGRVSLADAQQQTQQTHATGESSVVERGPAVLVGDERRCAMLEQQRDERLAVNARRDHQRRNA